MKNYIKPELEITKISIEVMMSSISISESAADPDVEVDAKKVNFADADQSTDF